jgi:arylsulfatase A-like enzyme
MTARVASLLKAKGVAVWLAPSVVAACVGAVVAGAFESRGDGDRVLIAGGLVATIALPVLVVASIAMRGLVAAWAPARLLESMREERGAMPRLAAWTGVVWLAMLGLAWAMFQGTWLLASWTAFKPNSISFLAPALAVLAIVIIVALSRPAADLFTWLARKIDRVWRSFAPGTLLSAPVIFGGALVTAIGAGYLIWALLISRRLPDASPSIVFGPTAALIVTVLAHAVWRGRPRARPSRALIARAIAGGVVVAGTAALIVLGLRSVRAEPATALAIWSDSPLARLAIERTFDVEDIRRDLPLDTIKPVARGDAHPDLVLITLDGVRADRTPPYGGAAPMPALADLGERGTIFKWAFAPSTTLRRSVPSIVTGVAPHRVRGTASETAFRLDPRHIGFAERLRAAGYDTAAFTCGFDALGDATRTWTRGFEHVAGDDDSMRLAYAAKKFVETRTSSAPLLLWVHLRVAWPGDREAMPTDQRLATYDRALAALDRSIAEVVTAFSGRTPDTAPIIVVAGARGEELGEHGQAFREEDLYNTQIHVPLVVAGPKVKPQQVVETVGVIDVMPSLVDLAGYAPPRGTTVDGYSFAPTLIGTRTQVSNVAFAAILPDRGTALTSMAVVRVNWKLIDTGSSIELYDLRTDPEERTNLASQRTQIVTEMRSLLTTRARAANTLPF